LGDLLFLYCDITFVFFILGGGGGGGIGMDFVEMEESGFGFVRRFMV
jgi:hypothetical protein